MSTDVDRFQLQRMVKEGAQLVDVLLAREYVEEHLPGAISLPLKKLDRSTSAQLDRGRPVILYCADYQ
jgi:phage shock protein E